MPHLKELIILSSLLARSFNVNVNVLLDRSAEATLVVIRGGVRD